MDFDRHGDERVRTATFEWLAEQVSIHGEVLPRAILAQGFELDRRRVPLLAPQGIFKPAVMQIPLSITTAPRGPYDDELRSDNLLRYRYRCTAPNHRENIGLKVAMANGLPLVYFHGSVPSRYLPMWPVYVVDDLREQFAFSISVDHAAFTGLSPQAQESPRLIAEVQREYAVSLTRTRLHQSAFRERVPRANQHQCAFCLLRHVELLEAAHIMPDSEPEGEPLVSNGIALCRLHHAAFDQFFLAVRPDHIIEVRPDVLEESDGPTLRHAIQGLYNQPIVLPTKLQEEPSIAFLAERYRRFRDVAATR